MLLTDEHMRGRTDGIKSQQTQLPESLITGKWKDARIQPRSQFGQHCSTFSKGLKGRFNRGIAWILWALQGQEWSTRQPERIVDDAPTLWDYLPLDVQQ
jgi:hypothetical protein